LIEDVLPASQAPLGCRHGSGPRTGPLIRDPPIRPDGRPRRFRALSLETQHLERVKEQRDVPHIAAELVVY
jgi:hypothetical protein